MSGAAEPSIDRDAGHRPVEILRGRNDERRVLRLRADVHGMRRVAAEARAGIRGAECHGDTAAVRRAMVSVI